MIPSSSSSLSMKGHGRPVSSLSRPVSRSTSRLSSGTTPRPVSSLSTRPGSSTSMRPQSRFSVRPHSRHARSRLIPNVQKLVTQVTGLQEEGNANDPDGESFQEFVEYTVRQLETSTISKAMASVDMSTIDKHIKGHALKAQINSKDVLAEALGTAYRTLKAHIENREMDLDQEIKTSHIPDHLQFLLALNQSPTDGTVEVAKAYLENIKHPPLPVPVLTWADILAEEPFEGEHWEGIFISPKDEWDSSPSLSPLNSDDLALDEQDDQSSDYDRPSSPLSPLLHAFSDQRCSKKISYTSEHREQFERLRSKQYWREEWRDGIHADSVFNIDNPSTLGPSVTRVLAQNSGFQDAHAILQPERYIHEDDMVREVLLALQGNINIIFTWVENSFQTTSITPRLNHLSLASQASILASLARTATTVELLRRFSGAVFSQSLSSHNPNNKSASTRTCEAFADAVDEAVRGFDAWCSAREESMCRAYAGSDAEPLIISLMETERAIRDEYETAFEVLLSITYNVFQIPPGQDTALFHQAPQRRQPAATTACLLDTLFSTIQEHVERCETVTSDALMRVFVRTAEPTWEMVEKWLRNGMDIGAHTGGRTGAIDELDDEFFIESSGIGIGMMGMGLLDPDFWKEGYALREVVVPFTEHNGPEDAAPSRPAVPLFLEHVAPLVLGTGKAVGLLTALGKLPPSTFIKWKKFGNLVNRETQLTFGSAGRSTAGLFSVSIDTLSHLIFDNLLPQCQTIAAHLVKVLVNDCFLWKHVSAIEDLFLMRKGDTVSHFIDLVFAKMDSPQPWADFHFLNAAFSDAVNLNLIVGAKEWINPSLVRFSYRGDKDKDRTITRTVKAIDGLAMEYAMPFPLTYIFPPRTIHRYGEVFTFLMQIRRAKNVLERILVRGEHSTGKRPREELKVFFAMRSRLSWFTNTLLNFITTYVIYAEVSRFHDAFRTARSLDEMIQMHDDHLDKIRDRCLLKPNTSALHRTIISILDMCLHFSEGFVTFSGDTTATLDVSRHSIIMKRHRSKRQARNRKNVIGFSQYLHDDGDSSDDDEHEGAENDQPEPSYSTLEASTDLEEDFLGRVEKMSAELDSLIRFLRRGVESLAGGSSEAASAFGVMAFSLEDWDL